MQLMGSYSCGAWTELLGGMRNLPGPEIEPMSPALAGGFLSTAPQGKSSFTLYILSDPIYIYT